MRELRLTSFKSYREQVLAFEPITLLIGKNGSGKSNVLDALALLALLADDRDVNDLERDDYDVAGLRGGLSGAAPLGTGTVRVGCDVETVDGDILELDVELDAGDHPEVVSETLRLHRAGRIRDLLVAERRGPSQGLADVMVYSGGAPRSYTMLSSRLISVQALTKVPVDSAARRTVVAACQQLVDALRGVFVLDPVPAQMRNYVRVGSLPDRAGANVSALLYALRDEPAAWTRLISLVGDLVESRIEGVAFAEARLPDRRLVDVMVALEESWGRGTRLIPARLMSDGTLRYVAIVASLLFLRAQRQAAGASGSSRRTLVIEEIENGLFPSQGERVLDLLREEAGVGDVQLVATTHSPALLDALRPEDHKGVIVVQRDRAGYSVLQALTEHPNYIEVAGGGHVGQSVTGGLLTAARPPALSLSDLFAS